MVPVKKHLDLLGRRAKDRVTGLEGVVVSVSFDLYGCVQAVLHAGLDKDGKPREQHYYDVARLEVQQSERVMDPPNYDYGPQAEGKQGPAEKPSFQKV